MCDGWANALPCPPLAMPMIAGHMSHKAIKVYSSVMRLELLERGHHDPTDGDLLCLLCKGTKQSLGGAFRPRLPVTFNVIKALKPSCINVLEALKPNCKITHITQ